MVNTRIYVLAAIFEIVEFHKYRNPFMSLGKVILKFH